jgi:hypothetical protein
VIVARTDGRTCLVKTRPLLNAAYLLGGHRRLTGLAELLNGLLVETQILLAADQNLGDIRAEMMYLRAPLSRNSVSNMSKACVVARAGANLLADVVQRIGGVDSEADQDDVGIGVRKGPQAVVVLLTSRIPKRQLDVLAIDLDIGNVVLENGGDVDLEVSLVNCLAGLVCRVVAVRYSA